jgi:SAM-dependent methyltransferase
MVKGKAWLYKFLTKTTPGRYLINSRFKKRYDSAANYWEKRYVANGTSGNGSYGDQAKYKASFINGFIEQNNIKKIIDFGCGDGNQLTHFNFPSYVGLDVSETAIRKCSELFKGDKTKSFALYNNKIFTNTDQALHGDLALSLDVIYHLIDSALYEEYMRHLFMSSGRFVIIYAWDVDSNKISHIQHRQFTKWIEQHEIGWRLRAQIKNDALPGGCDFYIYEKYSDHN